MQYQRMSVAALASASAALLALTMIIGAAQARQTPPPVSPPKTVPAPQVPGNVAPPSPALIAQGMKVYSSLDCSDCHLMNGKGTALGPDLSHIGATWTQAKLTTMIRHPKKLFPKGWMTSYGKQKIASPDLSALATYLASLK